MDLPTAVEYEAKQGLGIKGALLAGQEDQEGDLVNRAGLPRDGDEHVSVAVLLSSRELSAHVVPVHTVACTAHSLVISPTTSYENHLSGTVL